MPAATAIVIGGGVLGLSTAYRLARKRYGRIILLEKGPIGNGSSSRAAGIITGLLWSETGVLVRKRALELYRELSTDLAGYRFQNTGCLNLFDEGSWPNAQKLLPLYDRLGAPYEILRPQDVRERWPGLAPPDGSHATFDPLGGYSEPSEYLPALSKRAAELGVEVRPGVQVNGFSTRNGAVTGVRTNQGEIGADAVISCVYSWTNSLLEQVGVRLPVKCFVHQRFVSQPMPEATRIPTVNANSWMGYFRPALGGRLLAGIESADREEFRVDGIDFDYSRITIAGQLKTQMRDNLSKVFPAIQGAVWEEEKIGLLTFSMDMEPILGPLAGVPGLFVAVAFHSGGFAYNPAAGELMAEYVADGRTRIDVSSFSPNRFDPVESERYLAATIKQSDVTRRRH